MFSEKIVYSIKATYDFYAYYMHDNKKIYLNNFSYTLGQIFISILFYYEVN